MNTQQIEYFLATSRNGSFSETAKEFFTTQPTISRQISLLEDEIGFLLFDRKEKPLKLTAAGTILYEGFPAILKQQKALIRMGKMAAKGNYGSLSIGFCEHLLIENKFSEIFSELRMGCPGLKLNIQKIGIDAIREQVIGREIDVALTIHTRTLDSPELDIIHLGEIRPYILVNKHSPLASREFLTEEDLFQEKIYLAGPIQGYSIYNDYLCGFHLNRANIIKMDKVSSVLVNVQFGNGVTLVNDYMDIINDTEQFRAFPVLNTDQCPKIALVTRKKISNAAISFFRDLTMDYFQKKNV